MNRTRVPRLASGTIRGATPALLLFLTGCGIGYDRMFFFTKTNVGVDVDPQPPTAEITIARREGVIEPTFEGGQTLPVLASFTSSTGAAERFLTGTLALTFSTGDAAVALAKFYGREDVTPIHAAAREFTGVDGIPGSPDARISVRARPDPKPSWVEKVLYFILLSRPRKPYAEDEMVPLVFGTDTSFGLKVATSGQDVTASPSIQLGFRRKEFAWAPVFATPATSERQPPVPATPPVGTSLPAEERGLGGDEGNPPAGANGASEEVKKANGYWVAMPSLIATLDGDYGARAKEGLPGADLKYVQYFATGKAATYLALQPEVRSAMVRRIVPDLAVPTASDADKANREKVHAIIGKLDTLDTGNAQVFGENLGRLHAVARGVEFIPVIAGFEQLNAEDKRTKLREGFAGRLTLPMGDVAYGRQLDVILKTFETLKTAPRP